jgi:hypothetical protein
MLGEFCADNRYSFTVSFVEGWLPPIELLEELNAAIVTTLQRAQALRDTPRTYAKVQHWMLSARYGVCYHCGIEEQFVLDGLCDDCRKLGDASPEAWPSVLITR